MEFFLNLSECRRKMCKQPYEKFTQMHEALYIVLGFGAKGRVLFLVIAQYATWKKVYVSD